jgi:signal transduction histidine kinase
MSKLLAQLSQGGSSGASRPVSLADMVQRTALRAGTRLPVPSVVIEKDAKVMVDPEQFSMVLDHVLRNAQDATPANGSVDIRVAVENGAPQVDIRDNGSGMDETFVNQRLFRPFDTTKGARGMGIGAYQAREYMRSVAGDVRVTSRPGVGTTFTLVFAAGAGDVNHV